MLFKSKTRERLSSIEGDSAVQSARIQELDRQVAELQEMVQTLATMNQQMVQDMKLVYDSLTAIAKDSGASGLDKYFVSIINNNLSLIHI